MAIDVSEQIAKELKIRKQQVTAAVALLDEGATVPFVARYRKEVTGGLDDTQLRSLQERLTYLRELEERRATILGSIKEQEKLTPELEAQILEADTKSRLEDLYLPFKPKRRTKGQKALKAGLGPLADLLLADPMREPEREAVAFLNEDAGYGDEKAVLEGARYILMERFAEEADLVGSLREYAWQRGYLVSKLIQGQEQQGAKFSDYFDCNELIKQVPSHRALAMLRGSKEGVLSLALASDAGELEDSDQLTSVEKQIASYFGIADRGRPGDAFLMKTVRWTWRVKLRTSLELELIGRMRESAEEVAIKVFANNLNDLLMAAPAGPRVTMGLDPGLRTGVKVVVVDDTGKLLEHTTIFPHVPRNQWDDSLQTLKSLCEKYKVTLISIGNGTASRETDKLVAQLLKQTQIGAQKVVVSEAGASVYSASALAAEEFPDLDVSFRGAVSIARRIQDPLAELIKIDPKAIGVGQYQHDVNQTRLADSLDGVVETCVNAVGVDLNTASVPLLARVSGLNQGLARGIVGYRDQHGRFEDRRQLLKVPRLGAKTFEQAAGFLRIMGGRNPLDASAVHPEAYGVVQRIGEQFQRPISQLIGDSAFLRKLVPSQFTDARFGLPTVIDIFKELDKPGRDPRPEFVTAKFEEGVEHMEDLAPGMTLEGVVTNVTKFGAFVDVGVHQDGLVHISNLANRFVRDPAEVVKAGQIVKVRVLDVDLKRKRIGLTMRLDKGETGPPPGAGATAGKPVSAKHGPRGGGRNQAPSSALGSALAAALKKN